MKERGMGLLELLFSLFLSSLILLSLTQHYLKTKQQFFYFNTMVDKALELELVEDLLRTSIWQAGFTPCLNLNSLTSLDSRNGLALQAIEIKANSLAINRMGDSVSRVIVLSPKQLEIENSKIYEVGETILIADCYHAELQQIQALIKKPNEMLITLSQALTFNYQNPIYLGNWLEEKFFIKTNSQGKEALFYQQKRTEELSSVIQSLSTHLLKQKKNTFLQVFLNTDAGHQVLIETALRSL